MKLPSLKIPSLRTLVLTPVLLFVVLYMIGALILAQQDKPILVPAESPVTPLDIAIFGASGTAGDGILKAALASPDIGMIHVITRRVTQRMQAGMNSGKIKLAMHQDYLNYSAIRNQLSEIRIVYWAIGVSSLGIDEKTYGMIHVDFPMQFVKEWSGFSGNAQIEFHFISSSDISEDSETMWVREKIRAERSLFDFAKTKQMRVIAYRPDYIGPTKEEAHLGQDLLYWFFKPVGAAVKATQIGQAMIDVTLRGKSFANGSKLSTSEIILHSNADKNRRLLLK